MLSTRWRRSHPWVWGEGERYEKLQSSRTRTCSLPTGLQLRLAIPLQCKDTPLSSSRLAANGAPCVLVCMAPAACGERDMATIKLPNRASEAKEL